MNFEFYKSHFRRIGILILGVLVIGMVHAQETTSSHKKTHKSKLIAPLDSSWKKEYHLTDTASVEAINKIENINNTLKSFNNTIVKGYDTSSINDLLPSYQRNLRMIKFSVSRKKGGLNLRNLTLLQDMLDDMISDLKEWQTGLMAYYTQVAGVTAQMRAISLDSVSAALPTDSSLKTLYLRQLSELKTRLQSTDTVTKLTILTIDRLQTGVSGTYNDAIELQNNVNALLQNYNATIFDKTFEYLWVLPEKDDKSDTLNGIFKRSYKVTNRVVGYYVDDNWPGRVTAIVLSLLFFIWTFINFRQNKLNNTTVFSQIKYLESPPVIATLIFLFTLVPFLDLNPPVIFVEFIQLLLGIVLTVLLAKKWPRHFFVYWLLLFILLFIHSINGVLVRFTYTSRMVMLSLDIISIFIGGGLYKKLKTERNDLPSYIRPIVAGFILFNILSVLGNLSGRVGLSQIFGNTAISSLVQAIGLTVFIQLFLDAICLQLELDKKSTRFTAYLNYQNVALRVRTILTFIAGIFWLINLVQNLNIYQQSYDFLSDLFTRDFKIGNNSFTLGSIFTFFVVIWLANFIQKYIGYFFGDTEDDILPDKKSKLGTSVLLVRLIILTAGFFIGILASGIPLDKVTIVIGALGVGIGLGLQNIVNNLVSGVILAIERPIQVGDLIEIGSSSGHVKEIGIRASHIITPDGAEVIIPNGDMLSQKLINWTLSNTHIRDEIIIKLNKATDATMAKKLALDILGKNEEVMTKPGPQIIIRNINQAGAELQILFWAFDINKSVQLKSDVLQQIFEQCNAASIEVI